MTPGRRRSRTKREAVDKQGRPILLVADHGESSLLVRALRPNGDCETTLLAHVDGDVATIRSIACRNEECLSQGIGTAVLRYAEENLALAGAVKVVGWLSAADADHRDRQVHFYRKNGYDVVLEERTGRISKNLAASPWVRNNWPATGLYTGTVKHAGEPDEEGKTRT